MHLIRQVLFVKAQDRVVLCKREIELEIKKKRKHWCSIELLISHLPFLLRNQVHEFITDQHASISKCKWSPDNGNYQARSALRNAFISQISTLALFQLQKKKTAAKAFSV